MRYKAIIVAALLLLALYLRLINMEQIVFFFDSSRDLIISHHVFQNKQIVPFGPHISTGGRLGPLLYYLFAPCFLFSHKPEFFSFIIILSNVLAIYFVYLLSQKYFGWKAAIIALNLYAFNVTAMLFSRAGIWTPWLLPFFFSLYLYSIFQVLISKNNTYWVLLFISLAFLTHLHISSFIILGTSLLLIAYFKPKLNCRFFWIGLSLFILSFCLMFAGGVGLFILNLERIFKGLISTFIRYHGISNISFNNLFLFQNDRFISISLILSIAYLFFKLGDKKDTSKYLILLVTFIIYWLACIVFFGTKQYEQRYVVALFPLAFLLIGVAVSSLIESYPWGRRSKVVINALIIFSLSYIYFANVHKYLQCVRTKEPDFGNLTDMEEIVDFLITDSNYNESVLKNNIYSAEHRGLSYERGKSLGYLMGIKLKGVSRKMFSINNNQGPYYVITPFIQEDTNIKKIGVANIYKFQTYSDFARFQQAYPDIIFRKVNDTCEVWMLYAT